MTVYEALLQSVICLLGTKVGSSDVFKTVLVQCRYLDIICEYQLLNLPVT